MSMSLLIIKQKFVLTDSLFTQPGSETTLFLERNERKLVTTYAFSYWLVCQEADFSTNQSINQSINVNTWDMRSSNESEPEASA